MHIARFTKLILLSLVIAFLGTTFVLPIQKASAISGSDFKAGYIIKDSLFFRNSSMSPTSIKAFLESKAPDCETSNTCLSNRTFSTKSKSASTGLCSAMTAKSGQSAARIIYDVSNACGVDSKVLTVMLQKEQGLVTDENPSRSRFLIAMGYACPDTAPCDTEYYGFFNQVYNAAKQLKRYIRDADSFNFKAGRYNYIQYHPDASCGEKRVYIQNHATAALYNYTPYTPNAATISAGLGVEADPDCGAYGNKNFWWFYYAWFGNPTGLSYDSSRIQGPGSSSADVPIGLTKTVSVQFENTGSKPWYDPSSAPGNTRPVVLEATHMDGSASSFNDAFAKPTHATRRFAIVYDANGNPKTTNTKTVMPGQTVKFTFNIKTPRHIPEGQFRIAYRPIIAASDGQKKINIGAKQIYYANTKRPYVGQNISDSNTVYVNSGESGVVVVKFKNIGYNTWFDTSSASSNNSRPIVLTATHINGKASGFNEEFASSTRASQNFSNVFNADGSQKSSQLDRVEPGEIAEFTFDLKAPEFDQGMYRLVLRLVVPALSTSVPRINATSTQTLNIIIPPPYAALRIAGEGASSTTMTSGETKTVSVRFKNTGTKPWYDITTAASGNQRPLIMMATHVNGSPSSFNPLFTSATRATETFSHVYNTSGVLKTPNPHLALPGETVRYTFQLKAPSNLGEGLYRISYMPVLPMVSKSQPRISIEPVQTYFTTITN